MERCSFKSRVHLQKRERLLGPVLTPAKFSGSQSFLAARMFGRGALHVAVYLAPTTAGHWGLTFQLLDAARSLAFSWLGVLVGIEYLFLVLPEWLQAISQSVSRSASSPDRQSVSRFVGRYASMPVSQSGGRSVGPCAKRRSVSRSDSR